MGVFVLREHQGVAYDCTCYLYDCRFMRGSVAAEVWLTTQVYWEQQ